MPLLGHRLSRWSRFFTENNPANPATVRRTPPRLIAELIALTSADGRSLSELARDLEIDETTLMQYRSGRRPISMRTYARIVRRFGDHRIIRDLAFHYAGVEYHARESTDVPSAPVPLSAPVERALRRYAENFAEETLRGGRGLYLAGPDRDLTNACRFLVDLFAAVRVAVCRVRADRKPSASEMRDALAAPLFIVERVDFARDEVVDLIRRRFELMRPTVVSSAKSPEDAPDPYVRRLFVSSMRLVTLTGSPDGRASMTITQEHAEA